MKHFLSLNSSQFTFAKLHLYWLSSKKLIIIIFNDMHCNPFIATEIVETSNINLNTLIFAFICSKNTLISASLSAKIKYSHFTNETFPRHMFVLI